MLRILRGLGRVSHAILKKLLSRLNGVWGACPRPFFWFNWQWQFDSLARARVRARTLLEVHALTYFVTCAHVWKLQHEDLSGDLDGPNSRSQNLERQFSINPFLLQGRRLLVSPSWNRKGYGEMYIRRPLLAGCHQAARHCLPSAVHCSAVLCPAVSCQLFTGIGILLSLIHI